MDCFHSYQPSPFSVLDEVDAALDNTNVAKIANYIRSHASDTFQFIVISLKGSLYERSNSLVGIYRDQDVNSSRTLTLDVSDPILQTCCCSSSKFSPAAHSICRLKGSIPLHTHASFLLMYSESPVLSLVVSQNPILKARVRM